MFETPVGLGEYGFVVVTCSIVSEILSCVWGPLDVFYLNPSDVVHGTQIGDTVDLGFAGGKHSVYYTGCADIG